jgi:thiol-disulfide isomerase/thioredoxin
MKHAGLASVAVPSGWRRSYNNAVTANVDLTLRVRKCLTRSVRPTLDQAAWEIIMLHLLACLARTVGRALLHPAAVAICGVALLLTSAGLGRAQSFSLTAFQAGDERPKGPKLDLKGGTDWLNTDRPISAADLKGRIVLIDFWTLCCINCIHTLPDLAKLEAKYPGVLVVIGVHSPKFDNEKKTESIKKAVMRYEVKHPVINDADHKIWKRYSVESWPTLILFDPDGNFYGWTSGEGRLEDLDVHIGKLVKQYKDKKLLRETPLGFQLAREGSDSPLYFPGKVLADAKTSRLFIADSTNHRIVITDMEGKKIAVAGDGVEGLKDGPFTSARFSDPQGMALVGDMLFVADRKNHCLRALDLKALTVQRVAGTGVQDRFGRNDGGPALKTGLNSPWDLLAHDGKIYVAMAGHHQIWTFDPARASVAPFSGNGRETITDGPHRFAAFAQPSGLATDGTNLYVADSETSSIRSVPFDPQGKVTTVVGEGLFEFGDVDGIGAMVRLQHALGVAYKDGQLYVADTYNSKIKRIDPAKQSCTTFLGAPRLLNEPGGVSIAGNKLYIADTNNHRICVVDLTSKALTTLALQGVPAVPRDLTAKRVEPTAGTK